MSDDHLNLLFKVFLFAVIVAFYPQIMRIWRKLGYRSMKEQRELERPPDKKSDTPETRP